MTKKEAIDTLKLMQAQVEWDYPMDYSVAIDMAIAALAKEPEQLTDKEQRIFLAAMGREEEICKQVDDECRDCREPYEDSLVRICHEITRKVKCALWTI